MRNIFVLGFKLFLIAAVAGLALGLTNMVTSKAIAQQQMQAAEQARRIVLPEAVSFTEISAPEGLLEAFAGYDASGALAGKTGAIVVKGYAGEIEITVGINRENRITGVSVGGAEFAETAGLGARVKEAWFQEQFLGKTTPIALKNDGGVIDAITSATISSRAVTEAVHDAALALGVLALPTEG